MRFVQSSRVLSWLVVLCCCVNEVEAVLGRGKAAPSPPPPPPPKKGWFGRKKAIEAPPPPPTTSVETSKKSSILTFKRRPSVDSGLRYASNDWLISFISTPTSFILRRISFHLLFNVAVTLAVVHYYPTHPHLSIPMVGHSLLGSSLGLLLSYRTNSAYGRFWEARGHWTKSKSVCRNLATTIQSHIAPHAPRASKHLMELIAAFPLALMHLCLGGAARLSDHAQKLLPAQPNGEPDYYNDSPNLPAMLLCLEMHKAVHSAAHESRTSGTNLVEAMHLTAASHLIDSLMESLSSCEKILRTPVPWTYSRHTSRFLTLWMGTLPFALVGTLNRSLTLAVVVAASYCMFGIEEIGHLIEQPFVGDKLQDDAEEEIWSRVEGNGKASALIRRGRTTQPYDIGIPVCSLAIQIRQEVLAIAEQGARRGRH